MAEHELNKIVDDDGEVFNLRDSTKQPVADRVTAWGSTPSDTKYPSEKLVKDSLDGKVSDVKIDGTSVVSSGTASIPMASSSVKGVVKVDAAMSSSSTNTVQNKVVKAALDEKIPFSYKILDTNPFGGKHLYLNYIGNAMYSMDKRYFVTATFHQKVVDGVEYPRIKPGASITDDVYYEDSPVVSPVTSSLRTLFNGYYDSGIAIASGKYLKIHIQFSDEENWTPATGRVSDYEYNYGDYFLSFYYTNVPSGAKWRCYNTYAQHTIGWKQGDFSYYAGNASSTSGVILTARDAANHKRTCIEFIVFPKDNVNATLTQIDWCLDRPTLSRTFPFFTNFADQNSYVDWYFKQKVNSNATIEIKGSDGSIKAKSLTLTDTPLPISSGGTGKTSVTAGNYLVGNGTNALTEKTPNTAANELINALSTGDATPTGEDYYVSQFAGGGTTTKTYHRRPIKALWEYIKAQISSVLGLTATSYGGNAATATALASGSADRTKLDGIAAGAEVNVQSDWSQSTTTADDYIKNKPTLGTAAAKNVPTSGNASTSQVVMGNDTRLTDARLTTGPKYYDLYNSGTAMYGWHIGSSNVPDASNDGFFKAVICISRWTQSNTDSKPEECFGYLDITHRNSNGNEEYYARIYAIGGVTTASNMGWCVMAIRGDSSKKIDWYVVRNPDNEAASGEVGINWGALSVIPMVNTSSSFTLDTSLAHMTSKWTTYLNYYATKRAPYLTASQVGVGSNSEPVYVDNGQIKKCTGVQPSLSTQTAYTSKGSATKVPQITTNSLGQVTGINEVTISGVTPASHASSSDTYGLGTTNNYGHVRLATGDMNGATHADGVAVSKNHTHSQYLTSHQDISGKMATSASNATSEAGGNIIRSLTTDTNIGASEYIAAAGASSGQWKYTFSTLLDWINSKNVIECSPASVGTDHKRIQLGYGGYTNDNVGYCCYLVHIFFNYVNDNLVGKGVTVLVNYDWRKTAYQSAKCQILNDNGLSAAGYNVVLANFKTDNNTNLHITLGLVKNTAPTTLVGFAFSYCKIMRIAYGQGWTESIASDNVGTYNYLVPAVFGKADSFSTSVNAGSANQPVYFNNGVPTVCNWWVS